MLQPSDKPPEPQTGTVYLFELSGSDPDGCPKVFLTHQSGTTWIAERDGVLKVTDLDFVRNALKEAFDLGITIFALDREEFFRRLHRLRHPLSHANRN